ncbi:MAG: hypothetical protein ACOYYF_11150 [Chloroflexota bacterium]|nr:hypothetical protein [Chloroflexota bacterium]MBI5702483.1 hypothetical protein [Chloroflexota bacterium]
MPKSTVYIFMVMAISACAILPIQRNVSRPTVIQPFVENNNEVATVSNATEVIKLSSNECASPPVNLAYPVGTQKSAPFDVSPRVVIPPPEWTEEFVLPNALPYADIHQRSARSLVYQALDDRNAIWFSTGDSEDRGVYRYETETNKLLLYNQIDGKNAYPLDLFVSPDGILWGYTILKGLEVKEALSLLSHYDPKTDIFSFVDNPLLMDNGKYSGITDIAIDQQGMLWLAVKGEGAGILAFSSATEEIVEEYPVPVKMISNLEMAPNGNLWFLADDGKLYVFDADTKQTKSFQELYQQYDKTDNMLNNEIDTRALYFDREGKLWISDIGWLDFSSEPPIFFRIIRSSVFVNDYVSPHQQFSWQHPSFVYQATDKSFWFSGPGLVRLNFSKGEWCLLSSESSPIVEDNDGNLWGVFFSRIYKFDLAR